MRAILVAIVVFAVTGCASSTALFTTGSVVLVNGAKPYPANNDAALITQRPEAAYAEIAIVEAKGAQAASLANMMERLRIEAAKIGADAVIPVSENIEQSPQGLIYNPILGGYQAIGGARTTTLRGIAIRYTK